jgi:uncharacterized protein
MPIVEPTRDQLLEFCAVDPVERVFLEDAVRRGFGRFVGVVDTAGVLVGLCHAGANLVPSGQGCGAFAEIVTDWRARMIIGEERAVSELWATSSVLLPAPREDRPGQPVYVLDDAPEPGESGLRAAVSDDFDLLLPACAAAHEEEIGSNPLQRDPEGFRWRTRAQIDEGRSWVWVENGTILFKAEASAWTPQAVQLQQVWVDPVARGLGNGKRGLRDLCRLLLARVPTVCLFVRSDNVAAIRLYEAIGMRHTISYRSLIF